MFDKVEIRIKAGDGGDGAVSFRREKFVPRGGPDGGDGGRGGCVVVRADRSVSSLAEFVNKKLYCAPSGDKGTGWRKNGRSGGDLVLLVPPGTLVREKGVNGCSGFLADLVENGKSTVVSRGGKGGFGNIHFASPTNQVPRLAQSGEKGELKTILLELKLIADIGIIGYPNAGKSSLLRAASRAKPKIAAYPFTTLQPALGVVQTEKGSFLLAEVPGLIEEAHLGRGLGHEFLRHVSRTKALIHLVDGSSSQPLVSMEKVNTELLLFDSALSEKPQIVAVNKIDLPQVTKRMEGIREEFRTVAITPFFISALEGQGITELVEAARSLLQRLGSAPGTAKEGKSRVFHPKPKGDKFEVLKEGSVFVVKAAVLERLAAGSDTSDIEVLRQLHGQLKRQGVDRLLERAGVTAGARIRLGELEMKW